MRYWWVNQKQTYRHEVQGGYMWSPKRKSNGHRNPYYDFMREVAPGDIVFSFAHARIAAIGIARSHAYEAPKPMEFGSAGAHWELIGWRVDVHFHPLVDAIRPADFMDRLGPCLPDRYAPLQANGAGLQNLYLTHLPPRLAGELIDLIGREAREIVDATRIADEPVESLAIGLDQWEQYELDKVRQDSTLNGTDRQALVIARRGQGLFKSAVMRLERSCRITGVEREEHLRASHMKPWRDASNAERLDGENGLLLTPSIDHLFDRGFISFATTGKLLISPVAHAESLKRMGLPRHGHNVGTFSEGQKRYLEYHRESVFLESAFLRGRSRSR